jgi:putative transcriptional regulator
MSKTAFDKIAAGLAEVATIATAKRSQQKSMYRRNWSRLFDANWLTQEEFAARVGRPAGTIRDWEQHRRQPDGAARVLSQIIGKEPKAAARALRAEFADAWR